MKKLKLRSPLKQNIVATLLDAITAMLEEQQWADENTPDPVVHPIRGTQDYDANFNYVSRPMYALEKHVSVIRKGPTAPPKIQMYDWTDEADINTDSSVVLEASFNGLDMPQDRNTLQLTGNVSGNIAEAINPGGTAIDGSDKSIFYTATRELKNVGDKVILPIDVDANLPNASGGLDWANGMKLNVTYDYVDQFNNAKQASCRLAIDNPIFTWVYDSNTHHSSDVDYNNQLITVNTDSPHDIPGGVECTILAISSNMPIDGYKYTDIYNVKAEIIPAMFEFKFPKFAYRYKYEDGEYSVFSPWSEVAFMPGEFDYLPKKGYNLGMTNQVRTLNVLDWNPKNRPKDVVEIDLLYKESNSPNVYTVQTFKKDDNPPVGSSSNHWNTPGTGANHGKYNIQSELIHKVVASNQMLRPWDNVPRKALAQEITANRLIFANYVQNYNLIDEQDKKVNPIFNLAVSPKDYSLGSSIEELPKLPLKSLKSMRTYQVGVVYRDRYGRETPVLTSQSGSIEIGKESARLQNKLTVSLQGDPPSWAESYTFYVKETSNEYYNLAMDRWYDAEDDGVWISFPSSERNKISERTMLMLKKQHDTDVPVDTDVKYKVIDIKNDAPNFIKSGYKFWGAVPMMPPPPGWGETSNAGMFHTTGLPLPNRLYIDIYAEYFDQSVLNGLEGEVGAQIRVTQSDNEPTMYGAVAFDSIHKSKWYDVANISYIGSPAQTYMEETPLPGGGSMEREVEIPGQEEQIVRITLKTMMGPDLSFASSQTTQSLDSGLAIEVRTKEIEDKAQFEGRFFVKLLRDPELQTHIVLSGKKPEDVWQVLMAKDLKYICVAHPGVQEWMTGATGTPGSGKGRWYGNIDRQYNNTEYNYIPIGIRWQLPTVTSGGGHKKITEVSSLGPNAGDAPFRDGTNSLDLPPQASSQYWPMGPGVSANPTFDSGNWFFNKYFDLLDIPAANNYHNNIWNHGTSGHGNAGFSLLNVDGSGVPLPTNPGIFIDPSPVKNDWPSFRLHSWEGTTCGKDIACDQVTSTYTDRWIPFGDASGYLDLSLAEGIQPELGDRGMDLGFESGGGPNQYFLPAIWGDQDDLKGYSGTPNNFTAITDTTTAGIPTANRHLGICPHWKVDTIEKLRKNWYLLYYGKSEVSDGWPDATLSTERWFIDKAGAAANYSGNGIWTTTVNGVSVSKMDLSFYGIGSVNTDTRNHNLNIHQEDEAAFADLIMTPGTQFRFSQDPNSTIYTVTKADVELKVFNYEPSHGSWGYDDGTGAGNIIGGGSIGGGVAPPHGSAHPGPTSKAGKSAFISDLFNRDRELTGGAPYNYRSRVTITLDKEIGSEGVPLGTANMGFHPLLNHVDADGNCNIKGGSKIYSSLGGGGGGWWRVPQDTFPEDFGGLPTFERFYNLSSYWNYTGGSGSAPTGGQSSVMGEGDVDGMHFGLHERGLNSTTIEIVTPYKGDEAYKPMSTNPAVFETEPMEDVGLDIYYAASPTYPVNLERFRSDEGRPDDTDIDKFGIQTNAHYFDYGFRGEEIIPVGCKAILSGTQASHTYSLTGADVVGVQGNVVWINQSQTNPQVLKTVSASGAAAAAVLGDTIKFSWNGEGHYYGARRDEQFVQMEIESGITPYIFKVKPKTHSLNRTLNYFNCYSFSNGVESNRIRDDYNAVTIDKGVKASMPLAEKYKEERRKSSLIFSGIYNSTSGINRTNEFIQAEPITKDINPINGSIQKLFARDTDLVTFCENKVFKILAKKDALFNADGNTNVTSNQAVLGQAIPFSGEYGISKNPESFASESYRIYFTDKTRGAVLRLSRDGLTPISSQGMKDWFKDNMLGATALIGSYDDREDQYNLTLETTDYDNISRAYTLSYTESKRGWVSFKSFIQQDGISHNNIYYTFASNNYSTQTNNDPWGVPYSTTGINTAEMWQHHYDLKINTTITGGGSGPFVSASPVSEPLQGMNISGNGIPYGTTVSSYNSLLQRINLSLPNLISIIYTSNGDDIKLTMPRNSFYGNNNYSMVKTMFNQAQGTVKRFKTINYEGSQSKVVPKTTFGAVNQQQATNNYEIHTSTTTYSAGQVIEDNFAKDGWYVEEIKTDLQSGTVREFVNKENKYFEYIKGVNLTGYSQTSDDVDTGDFSFQGLGKATNITTV